MYHGRLRLGGHFYVGLVRLLGRLQHLVDGGFIKSARPAPERDPFVGQEVNQEVYRDRCEAQPDAHQPLVDVEVRASESRVQPRDLHQQNLNDDGAEEDYEEHVVVHDALEHVELVVDLPRIHLVENLKEDEDVEDDGVVLGRALLAPLVRLAVLRVPVRHHHALHPLPGVLVLEVEGHRARARRRRHRQVEPEGTARGNVERLASVESDEFRKRPRRAHLRGRVGGGNADVADHEDQPAEDHQLPRGVQNHVLDHGLGEDAAVARVWLPEEQRARRILGRESERGEGVHDEVNPQHLDGGERRLGEDCRPHTCHHDRRDVHRELELEEAADVVVHAAPPHDCLDDRDEVVVHDDNVGGVLRHVRALEPHREPHVRLLEGGGVVGSVASHGDSLPVLPLHGRRLEAGDEHVLVEGCRAAHDAQLRPDLVELHLVELAVGPTDFFAEGLAVNHGPGHVRHRIEDAALLGDRRSRLHVVSRHHAHDDAGLLAILDRRRHLVANGVLDTDERHHDQVLLGLVDVLDGVGSRADGEAERAERLIREPLDHLVDLGLLGVGHGLDLAGRGVALVAEFHHHLRRALRVDPVGRAVLDAGGHALAFRRESELLPTGLVFWKLPANSLVRLVLRTVVHLLPGGTKGVRHREQPALRVVAGVDRRLADTLEVRLCHCVDHRGLDELLAELLGELGRVGNRVLRPAAVHLDDRHAGGGEGAGLVGADGGGRAHRLAR
mmetsp:Transcript_11063/g.26857  ORF Transcript_11063/g.26857 Transcript_11063/m.26857 type:complete len:727 (-) Transcript_11063:1527-3707(-)